ncbi:MAG: TIGR03617 family F420-dependent LLM class oxidoreductase [Myxococcota bacterium]|nr:TIGR03617 family F420-dependent LLM class oxidoreductase [Myxococcota bacterium]
MKVLGGLMGDLGAVPERARQIEAKGYDGAVSAEVSSDPFMPLLLAAEHTERIELMTSIAVAFARNPMTMAQVGHDLNAYSKGRAVVGLGSQIRPHITKRFSMEWSHPAARMREFILAMRAVWDCWYREEKLDFRGEFYQHTLMTPMFTPRNTEYGAPAVSLAAVGPLMTEVAGEVADGLIAHAFTTQRYLREVTLPALERGFAKSGRARADFEITCPVFVVSGADEKSFEASRRGVAQQVSFYGSTPAYRPVLEMHGWGDLQTELTRMSKQGLWVEMGGLITDEILNEFAVVAEPGQVAGEIVSRYGGVVDAWLGMVPGSDPDLERQTLETLRAIPSNA